jgi:dipeptidyl aminopeptidase/acylaminoacyl peptidase
MQIVRTDAKVIYAPPVAGRPGYLLWLREQTLMAQIFDAGKLRLEGDPSQVAEEIAMNSGLRRPAFWTSDAGLLLYRSGPATVKSKMLWKSRDGKRVEQVGPEDYYGSLDLSSDGKRVVLNRGGGASSYDLWVFEFGRSVMTRVTFDGRGNADPVWSPDGRQIAFVSWRTGVPQLYRKDASGEGKDEQLTEEPRLRVASDWSPDGRFLLFYHQGNSKLDFDLSALPLDGVRKPLLVAQMPGANYDGARFSPDGKWIAYESYESGRIEIYIRPFTGAQSSPVGKWQVSSQGGVMPRWRGDGKELFYVSGTGGGPTAKMMAAGVHASAAGMQTDTPHELFPVSFPAAVLSPHDISADGQRFLVLEAAAGGPTVAPLTVVLNWQAGLKK